MVMQKDIQQDTSFAQRGLPVAPAARSALCIDKTETFFSRTRAQSAVVIDFYEEGDRLQQDWREAAKQPT
jgi:hypothetical protein